MASSSFSSSAANQINKSDRIHLIKFLTILESLEWILSNPNSEGPAFELDDRLVVSGRQNRLPAAVKSTVPKSAQTSLYADALSSACNALAKRVVNSQPVEFSDVGRYYSLDVSSNKIDKSVATMKLQLTGDNLTEPLVTFEVNSYLGTTNTDTGNNWAKFRDEGLLAVTELAKSWKSRPLAEASLIIEPDKKSTLTDHQFYCLIHETKQGSAYARHLSSIEIAAAKLKLGDTSPAPPEESEPLESTRTKKRKLDDTTPNSPTPPTNIPNPQPRDPDTMDVVEPAPTSSATETPPVPSASTASQSDVKINFNPTSQHVASYIYIYQEMFAILCNPEEKGDNTYYQKLIFAIPNDTETTLNKKVYTLNVQKGVSYTEEKIDTAAVKAQPLKKDLYLSSLNSKQKRLERLKPNNVEKFYGVDGSLVVEREMVYIIFDAQDNLISQNAQLTPGAEATKALGYQFATGFKVTPSRVFYWIGNPIIALLPAAEPKIKQTI